jgi:hypothetical protein
MAAGEVADTATPLAMVIEPHRMGITAVESLESAFHVHRV